MTLRDAAADKENPSGGVGANHKVPDLAAKSSQFSLRFGADNKPGGEEYPVGAIKAIYGKFVKDGKLTLENKHGVKVFIKASPDECARLMKTLTTLKGGDKEVRAKHLADLKSCAKCDAKRAAQREKNEQRAKKLAEQQLEKAEAEMAKKRKREEGEREREALKAQKRADDLRRAEERDAALEAARADVELAAKRRLEERRGVVAEEKARLRAEEAELAKRRAELETERETCEAAERDLAKRTARLESGRRAGKPRRRRSPPSSTRTSRRSRRWKR